MPRSFRLNSVFVLFASCLGLTLFSFTLTIGELAAASTSTHSTTAPQLDDQPENHPFGATDTFQDFDAPGTGTPYTAYAEYPGTGPQRLVGGPTGLGDHMRLAFDTPLLVPSHNSITFDRTHSGTATLIVADFDFRVTVSYSRADGLAFALLETTEYGNSGEVVPHTLPPWVAEEPNFVNSLGIGFDIYKSNDVPPDINNNHISVHFDGEVKQMFNAASALNLADGLWTHARVVMRPGGGYSDVTVTLTRCGGPPVTVVDQYFVPGFTPYEGRVYFAARSGGESADQDIDNVQVQFLDQDQSVLAFGTGCASVVETDNEVSLTITRMGDANSPVTVTYNTVPLSAAAGSDYITTNGTITFSAGEITKTISVPIVDDLQTEGDEVFQVILSNATGGGTIGGPAILKVTIVDDEAAQPGGHWSEVMPLPVIPIHAHLLPTGDMMFWDRHDHALGYDGNPWLWDPATGLTTMAMTLTYDIFCSGHSFMADGRLLVSGGHIMDAEGEHKASIYDPFTDSWESLPDMNNGRWYPSNATLANGDVLVMAGTFQTGQVNTIPQVWEVNNNGWRDLTNAAQGNYPDAADYYPFLYQAPNGQVFVAGPQQMARYLNTSGTGQWIDVAPSTLIYRDYGSSVMYGDGQVLIMGGSADRNTWTPTDSAEVINLNDATPVWRTVSPMNFPRRHHVATLLPDGTVLVSGGTSLPGFDVAAGAVVTAEMWNPVTEQWTLLAAQERYRGYHANALLLPDGRVLVGGGGHPPNSVDGRPQYNFEIYSPPYLFRGPRPVIDAAPPIVSYNHTFSLETANAASIENVTWIRLGSVTHGFNENQRINHLAFTQVDNGLLHVTTPADPNLAPPGYYMLFILDENGVPSVAQFVQLRPPGQIDPPAASFASSSPDALGQTTLFTNTSTGTGLIYTWNFGDNSPLSYQIAPAHSYAAAGDYTVILTATNPVGSHAFTRVVSILQTPQAGFLSSSPDNVGQTTVFTSTSSGTDLSYDWDFGDVTSSTNMNPTHVYPAIGTYTVLLTVTNAVGSDTAIGIVEITPWQIFLPLVMKPDN